MGTDSTHKKPVALYVLAFLMFFQAVSGLYGGISLVADPTGGLLKMGPDLLGKSPFGNFLVPGLILALVLGVVPLLLVYPLLAQPRWSWADKLNIYSDRHWAWTYSLFTGLAIIIWIDVQIYMIGYSQFIQTFIAGLGVLITVFTLWPSVMRHFRRDRMESSGIPQDSLKK
jgi:hypothetical protein